jgi:zinc-ribbon domain
MSEANTSGFCVNCGAPMVPAAKFCASCGTERAVAPSAPFGTSAEDTLPPPLPSAPRPEDVPDEVPLPPAPPRVSLASHDATPLSNRNRAIVIGVVVGVAIVAAGGLAYAKSSTSDHTTRVAVAPVTSPAATSPPVTRLPSTAGTPTTSASDVQSVVTQLDAKLSESAGEVGQLKAIIAQFDPTTAGNTAQRCGLTGVAAAAQTQPIIDNRKTMVADLDILSGTASGNARQLVTLLHSAIDLSLQSDYAYQAWMTDNASTDASDPCARLHDSNSQSFQDIAPRAGATKKAFLAAYLPVAARLGMRADWKYTDF